MHSLIKKIFLLIPSTVLATATYATPCDPEIIINNTTPLSGRVTGYSQQRQDGHDIGGEFFDRENVKPNEKNQTSRWDSRECRGALHFGAEVFNGFERTLAAPWVFSSPGTDPVTVTCTLPENISLKNAENITINLFAENEHYVCKMTQTPDPLPDLKKQRYVLAGSNGFLAFSEDAVHWQIVPSTITYLDPQSTLRDVVWGNHRYILASPDCGALYCNSYTSTDGIKWQQFKTPNALSSIATWIDGRFFVASRALCNGAICSSVDGLTWQPNFDEYGNISQIIKSKDLYLAVDSSCGNAWIYTSQDGSHWSHVSTLADNTILTAGREQFFAVSRHSIFNSTDGQTWNTFYEFKNLYLNGIVVTSKQIIVLGRDEEGGSFILTSNDGQHWTSQRNPILPSRITQVGDIFFILGYDGDLLTSQDGITWTKQNIGTHDILYAVAKGKDFIAQH